MPLSAEELASEAYTPGVSCPHCIDQRDEAQRARYAERQKQQQLAKKRGEAHVGATVERDQQETLEIPDGGWEANFPNGVLSDRQDNPA